MPRAPTEFMASFSLKGNTIFSGSTDQTLTLSQINDILNFGTSAALFLFNNQGTTNLPGMLGTAGYAINLTNTSLPSPGGTYTIDVDLNAPIGPTVDNAIQQALGFLGLPPTTVGNFMFPNNDTGTFRLDVSVAAVPLPATLPMLAAGGVLLVVLRRRATKAPA